MKLHGVLLFCLIACHSVARADAPTPPAADGQHDFDFLQGTWNVHVKRMTNPLAGAPAWIEMTGVNTTRKIWNGRANLDEFEADGPTGHHESMTLRLYNPESHQWSLYWSASKDGTFGVPGIGEFKNGRGEFYDQELWHGKAILVRAVWSNITPSSCEFEQSFSIDGGKTWEPNWIAKLGRAS